MSAAPQLPFGSQAWFERARELTADLPLSAGATWRLQFDTADDDGLRYRWFQVLEDGRVLAWCAGELDDPDLELRLGPGVARSLFRGTLSGTEALAATRVVAPDGSEGPAPPVDRRYRLGGGALPAVPGATITVQYGFTRGPFGPVECWMALEEGQLKEIDFGVCRDPDVRVTMSFQRMVDLRNGVISVLEALEDGGQVDGEVGPLMLLAGLEESPELQALERGCGPAGDVLAKVGALTATSGYASAMSLLAAETA